MLGTSVLRAAAPRGVRCERHLEFLAMRPFKSPQASSLARLAGFAGFALCLSSVVYSPVAQACGGTFCDVGPTAMPVDQTGENILFKLTDTTVEAHIQIQIDPETTAEQFAWVIPVTTLPEFEVGSQQLFTNLLNASVPSFGLSTSQEFCGDIEGGGESSGGWDSDGDSAGDPTTGTDTGEPPPPEVVFEGSVGAFEIAVLDGGTVETVMAWLADNGYQQDPAAEPILAEYLEQDFLFVALKLGVEADVDEIHPIVIRYEGDEPCVPIRLTRIAAAEDMEIRTFFLGNARVVPTNFRHVLVNPLKLDWFNNANNYKEVITLAVDADEANGNAFVTEYAGPSNIVPTAGLFSAGWNPDFFRDLVDSPVGTIEGLVDQGLLFCDGFECFGLHPLLDPILDEFIPVPDGVTREEFYGCLECFPGLIDIEAWDSNAFATRLDERIVTPGQNARDLINDNPYLTRMYTTISPGEMNADPIFAANTTLGDVDLRNNFAARFDACDGMTTVTLPDGRAVLFGPNTPRVWPQFQSEMPWEEDVDEAANADDAPLISLVDNTGQINELLDDYNRGQENLAGGVEAGADEAGLGSGCGCVAAEDERAPMGGLGLSLGLLALCGLVRRRRAG